MTNAATAKNQFKGWMDLVGLLPDKEEHELLGKCSQQMTDRMVEIEMSGAFVEKGAGEDAT
jgi:hypothetical protein